MFRPTSTDFDHFRSPSDTSTDTSSLTVSRHARSARYAVHPLSAPAAARCRPARGCNLRGNTAPPQTQPGSAGIPCRPAVSATVLLENRVFNLEAEVGRLRAAAPKRLGAWFNLGTAPETRTRQGFPRALCLAFLTAVGALRWRCLDRRGHSVRHSST
jgi:hypothetical protein